MKILILAAGRGERLMPLTQNTPKPLLDMGNGRTLLEEQLARIRRAGTIDEVVLVIGYLAAQIEAKMQAWQAEQGLRIETVFNPFYDVSNNLMSLWLAKHAMGGEDFMVTNGDNLFVPEVFTDLAAVTEPGVWLAVGERSAFDFDDMRVEFEGDVVARVSKQLSDERSHAESPGLCLVRGERSRRLFVRHLESLAREPEALGQFWLELFNRLYDVGVPVCPWRFDTASAWQEMDFHHDVELLRERLRLKRSLLPDVPEEPEG